MRSAFSLQVSATVVLCHVKLMSGVLSLEVREQMLCSALCNSAATSIVYLFTSFLGSDVNVETRCIVHRVNIHILICTLNVRETSDDWQTGIFNISCTSRGFCRGCLWDLENCIVTMSVFVYDAVDLCDVGRTCKTSSQLLFVCKDFFPSCRESEKCSETGVILAIMISNLLLWNHSKHSCTDF